MKKQFLPLLAAGALAIAGCGSDSSDDAAQEAAGGVLTPQQVVDKYRAAIIGGDGETACSLLDDKAKADVEGGGTDCASRLGSIADQDTPEDTAALKAMHPKVKVTGNRGVARLKTIGGDPTKIVVVKQGAAWKVTDSPELVNVRISNG